MIALFNRKSPSLIQLIGTWRTTFAPLGRVATMHFLKITGALILSLWSLAVLADPASKSKASRTCIPSPPPEIVVGSVNCRSELMTGPIVDQDTCAQFAGWGYISLSYFYTLNPMLDGDCGNLQPKTKYCIAGCEYSKATHVINAHAAKTLMCL